jgi:hypothetical protein
LFFDRFNHLPVLADKLAFVGKAVKMPQRKISQRLMGPPFIVLFNII